MPRKSEVTTVSNIVKEVLAGDRRAIAQAITLVESIHEEHREIAEEMLEVLLPHSGCSIRVAVTGLPGVGKSSFIEAIGLRAIDNGHRVAVLAVDPSSSLSGGSILGDKTRMKELGRSHNAFVRPSPTGGALGGVTRRSREVVIIFEAAGYDFVLVETVGVGQSETSAADMTDIFILMLLPGAGDELQGIKRGVVELADLILINKADGELAKQAAQTAVDYLAAQGIPRSSNPNRTIPIKTCSMLDGVSVEEIWTLVGQLRVDLESSGELVRRRFTQALSWVWSEIGEEKKVKFKTHDSVMRVLPLIEKDVAERRITPKTGARLILEAFRDSN